MQKEKEGGKRGGEACFNNFLDGYYAYEKEKEGEKKGGKVLGFLFTLRILSLRGKEVDAKREEKRGEKRGQYYPKRSAHCRSSNSGKGTRKIKKEGGGRRKKKKAHIIFSIRPGYYNTREVTS